MKNTYTHTFAHEPFSTLSSTAQTDSLLRRHFIISIDRFPHVTYRKYVLGQNVVDTVSRILAEDFKIKKEDYVSIVFYGIWDAAENPDSFILLPKHQSQSMQWMKGDNYQEVWRNINIHDSLSYPIGCEPFSLQAASKEYSFHMVTRDKANKCNLTYVLRITDNKTNNGNNACPDDEFNAYRVNGGRIEKSKWMEVIDELQDKYLFEKRREGENLYVIDKDYGIYICQVIQKEKPSVKSTVKIVPPRVKQIKEGHDISFAYNTSNSGIDIERISVTYKVAKDSTEKNVHDSSAQSGNIKFIIPDSLNLDSLNLRIKVWVLSKDLCGAMVISPYDPITGNELEEVMCLPIEYASILGIPLTKEWPWFSDDAQRTASIWTIVIVVFIVFCLLLIYNLLRKYRITKDDITITVESQSSLIVDLIDKNREKVVVAKIRIDIRKPYWSKGRAINKDVSAEIQVSNEGKFVIDKNHSILVLSKDHFCIKDFSDSIEVYACPQAFNDFGEAQTLANCSQSYPLPSILCLRSKDGNELARKQITFEVKFEEIKHTPNIVIKTNDKEVGKLNVTYKNNGGEDVLGTVNFVETMSLRRCPVISSLEPKMLCKEGCKALYIKNGNIVLDYSYLQNPVDEYIDYHYTVEYIYNEDGYTDTNDITKEITLRVLRNNTAPQLRVWVKDRLRAEEVELVNDQREELSDIHFIPGDNLCEFINDVTIENVATEGPTGAAIKISNLKVTPQIIQRTAPEYDDNAFVDFLQPEEEVILRNGGSERINPKIGWHAAGRKIDYYDPHKGRRYDMTVKVSISFDYAIDRIGNGKFDAAVNYATLLSYKIYQDVRREWLGIDFGTSAIVASYHQSIMNLRKRKKDLYEYEEVSSFKEDIYEKGTKFLSSNVIFKDTQGSIVRHYPALPSDENEEKGGPYHSAAICLSPTSSMEQSFNDGILPCLKLMVGYEQLPMLLALSGKRYSHNGVEITFGNGTQGNPLAKVENVFREVYSQLLRFFILPQLQGKSIDNVVLTVPNTYTSSHLHILKDCIKQSSIGNDVRNIRFVSESDAVACYYQSNWAQLNSGRLPLTDENVLVYDMGAGTLDISLLNRKVSDGATTITVIGKIGVGRSGNYLDTLLANAISSTHPESGLSRFLAPNRIEDPKKYKIASAWKHVIRDVIKPLLNSTEDSHTLSKKICETLDVNPKFTIDLSALRDSEEYKGYINLCSSGILDTFFAFQGFDKVKKRPRIDTIVLSGRASNQPILIEQIKSTLADWCENESVIIPLWQIAGGDASKTSVIEGAINLMSRFAGNNSGVDFVSSNITADYGIVFKDELGRTRYIELLNHNMKPQNSVTINGVIHTVYHNELRDIDLHTVRKISLIQTYTKTPILSEATGTLSEYCTVMDDYFIPDYVDEKHVNIGADIDEEGKIKITIEGAGAVPQAATKVDLNSDIYQKGLWPMMEKSDNNVND